MLFNSLGGLNKTVTLFCIIPGLFLYTLKPAFAVSGYSCLKGYAHVMNGYFSGQSDLREMDRFFGCVDSVIQNFLDYTVSYNQRYYIFSEINRFMQYMGFQKHEAENISHAVFYVKAGLVGGDSEKLYRSEINNFRQVLIELNHRLQRMQGSVLILRKVFHQHFVPRDTLLEATKTIQINLQALGGSFSKHNFVAHWDRLLDIPDNFNTLGFSFHFRYWKPLIASIRQWNRMFYTPDVQTVDTAKWPLLMNSLGEFIGMWTYYKGFIEGRDWSQVRVVQHVQYLMSRILDAIEEAQKDSYTDTIFLSDIDQLVKHVWQSYDPFVFPLGFRSFFCFILNRYVNGRSCLYNIEHVKDSVNIQFRDKSFHIPRNAPVAVSLLNNRSEGITHKHIGILRKYLDFWIKSENFLRKNLILPVVFGFPNEWLNRNVGITTDGRIQFHKREQHNNKRFLSYLNWQSHFMFFVTSAYKGNKESLTSVMWETITKEWTPLILSLMPGAKWQDLHKESQLIFKHGDFLMTHSNGDQLLQDDELLELFSIFVSTSKAVFAGKKLLSTCKVNKDYFNKECFGSILHHLPEGIFKGFPYLRTELSQRSYSMRTEYLTLWLNSLNEKGEVFSIKDLFILFLKVHYQENMMEHLDKDFNHILDVEELEPLLNTFESTLIEKIPVVYTKRDAMAFISYLFYYRQVPIFNHQHIYLPLHFSHWLLSPREWSKVRTHRSHLLDVLEQIDRQL